MNFTDIVTQILENENVAGGAGSVFGSGASANSSVFSSDKIYNPNDARIATGTHSITRRGLIPTFLNKKNKKSKNKKK